MDSFGDGYWDCIEYNLIADTAPSDFDWINDSYGGEHDHVAARQGEEYPKNDCGRKRERNNSCGRVGSKACREKMRREKLNDRFLDLSSTLEPNRPAKTDKLVILNDAIQVVKQLRTEARELNEANEKLLNDIKNLKAEKIELREEKLKLKADKERMEQQLKPMGMPPAGFIPTHPAAYNAGGSKMPVYPSYGLVPMWQYLSPSTVDTSRDHELRPPAA